MASTIAIALTAVAVGFVLLVWGADRCVLGASATARNFGVSPLIIGLTIVGLGTSAPEMVVSAVAAWSNNAGLAIGNAIGSNIANIGLVVGVTAVITPLAVRSEMLKREFPILFAIILLALVLMMDGELGRIDGIILIVCLGMVIYWLISLGLRTRRSDPIKAEYDVEITRQLSTPRALFWLILGLIILVLSSRLLVWGAVDLARAFGVSDLVIGLTVVAVGTSLPELSASVVSAIRGEHDIAIGNVMGSNMFNLLGVLAMPALIQPGEFDMVVLSRDIPVMIVMTLVLFVMAYGFRKAGHVKRFEGLALVSSFCAYTFWIYYSTQG